MQLSSGKCCLWGRPVLCRFLLVVAAIGVVSLGRRCTTMRLRVATFERPSWQKGEARLAAQMLLWALQASSLRCFLGQPAQDENCFSVRADICPIREAGPALRHIIFVRSKNHWPRAGPGLGPGSYQEVLFWMSGSPTCMPAGALSRTLWV